MFEKFGMFFNRTKFWTKKHSPEILIASSIVSMFGAVVTAIVATSKLDKTLEPINKEIEEHRNAIKEDTEHAKEHKKELVKTYVKAGLKVSALYLPTTLFFTTGMTCIFGSHKIMKGRNLALAAAYTTLENGYNAYRQRVKDKYGEDAEEKLYKDIHKEKVEVIDAKTGKVKTVTKEVPHCDKESYYDVMWDCGQLGWCDNAVQNFEWLMLQQAYFNDRLRRQGYLFLSDVYSHLGFDVNYLGTKRAEASRVLGWIYDPLDKTRDNYVSFGLTQPGTNIALPKVAAQIEKNGCGFWLSFNVDGDIFSGKNGQKKYTDYAREGY